MGDERVPAQDPVPASTSSPTVARDAAPALFTPHGTTAPMTPATLLGLQQLGGNQAVTSLLNPDVTRWQSSAAQSIDTIPPLDPRPLCEAPRELSLQARTLDTQRRQETSDPATEARAVADSGTAVRPPAPAPVAVTQAPQQPPVPQAEEIGDVLAQVKFEVPRYAREFADAALARLDPGGSVAALSALRDEYAEPEEAGLNAEIDGVAAAAGVTAEQMAAKVEELAAAANAQADAAIIDLDAQASVAADQVTARGDQDIQATEEASFSFSDLFGGVLDQWRTMRNAQTRDTISSDLELLARVREQAAAGNRAALAEQMATLSAQQRTLVLQFLQSGGQDPIAAVAGNVVNGLRERRVPDISAAIERRVIAEFGWEDLNQIGASQSPGFDAGVLVRDVRGAVRGMGTDEDRLFTALTGRTPIQIAAMRKAYAATYDGRDMDEDIADDLSDESLERAQALMSGDPVAGAIATLNEAMAGAGTSEATIMQTLRNRTPAEREAIVSGYRERYGVDLTSELSSELGDNELAQATALLSGDTAAADAAALREAMDGLGTDEAAIHGVYSQIQAEVEADAAARGLTTEQIAAEVRRRTEAVRAAYGEGFDADVEDELSGGELRLAQAEQAYDLTGMDAARIQIEHESFYTDDEAVNAVLRNQYGRARRDVMRDLEVSFMADPANQLLTPAQRVERLEALRAEAQSTVDERAMQNMRDLEAQYDANNPMWGPGAFRAVIAFEVSGYSQDEANDLIRQGGHLTDVQEMHYAVAGGGTNEAMIRQTLRGKSREEIEALAAQYRELTGGDLTEDLEGDLSGRDWADTAALLNGTKTPEEQMAYMQARRDWEVNEGTGILSEAFDNEEEDVLNATTDEARRAYDEYQRLVAEGASPEEIAAARQRMERWFGYGDKDVEEHRAAVDSATDAMAMAAAVAAGIAVTVLTAGAAGPAVAAAAAYLGTSATVVAAVAGGIAATAASIAVKAGGRGAAYGGEDLAVDLAQGLVDAIVAGATAGMGARALEALMNTPAFASLAGAARAGTWGTIGLKGLEGGIEGAIGGLPSGMAGAILNESTWRSGDPLGTILRAGGTAAATGFGTGAAVGAGAEAWSQRGAIMEWWSQRGAIEMPVETVMQPADPRNRADAETMYRNTIAEDPLREAAIYRNTETGEYIVVQGDSTSVQVAPGEGPAPGGNPQRWKEILDGQDVGSWELMAHSHPSNPATNVVDDVNMWPSGGNGDMGVLYGEAFRANGPRSSEIHYTTADGPQTTTFGVDPGHPEPFWVEIPAGDGIRIEYRFATMDEYHNWMSSMGAPQGDVPTHFPSTPQAAGRPEARPNEDNSVTVRATGEIEDAIARADAPGYENYTEPGSQVGLPDYQRAHMWGPGFGDELADGIMMAHRDVNLKLQNSSIERAIRELHTIAQAQGCRVVVSVEVTSHPRVPGEPVLLAEAHYRVSLQAPDGTIRPAFEADIGPIGRPGTPSSMEPEISATPRDLAVDHPELIDILADITGR
ncbi:polymorphic toxin type 4 domain-containing protein [Kibdelosporangium philippinense]|uniref:Polymorphic toxin type 4 domain-containing protein n=1 Tax=Kibdelosporangium philippinense TaxID=211113 RepID=A0ABS8ZC42_9PSEU|nr:polymorphic toxin type 4 domain-containing protein [Kibdelosporangium philippinense]MCE7004734.1 polymorphic toxin type 4 domain-containing protein [Kibdelosporangium philippinense]